jgi:hypothetical protein
MRFWPANLRRAAVISSVGGIALVVAVMALNFRPQAETPRLVSIPERYRVDSRLPWLSDAHGLDSSTPRFRLPQDEVAGLVPRDKLVSHPVGGIAYAYGEVEFQRAKSQYSEMISQINARTGLYSGARVEQIDSRFYKLLVPELDLGASTTWFVLARTPPIAETDIIARCTRFDGAVMVRCHTLVELVEQVGFELSIPESYLPYVPALKGRVATLLRTWRKALSTDVQD